MRHDEEEGIPLMQIQHVVVEPSTHNGDTSTPQEQEQQPHEIIHKIQIDDTLQGLSLQYGVSVGRIKQRNNLHSNDVYYLKSLIIPDPTTNNEGNTRTPEELQRLKEQYAINGFMNELEKEDRSHKVARYYLQQNDWNIYKATAEYKEHLEWQKKHKGEPLPEALEQQRRAMHAVLNLKERPGLPKGTSSYPAIELNLKKKA